MSDIKHRLRASVRMDAVHGDTHERSVCARQMVEAADEINRLTRERDEARAERERFRAALNTIARTPAMPFPDPGAHSARAYHEAVFVAWSRSNQTARAALAQIEKERSE